LFKMDNEAEAFAAEFAGSLIGTHGVPDQVLAA
jgi:hypothetical protein